jgi:UDP-glucose 4-epimerase
MIGAAMHVTLIGPDLGRSRYASSLVTAGAACFVQCDASFGDAAVLRELGDADALVALGYVPPASTSGSESLRQELDLNVTPLARLVEAFAGRGGGHVVFASSDAVYGELTRTPVRESDMPRPRTAFGLAKLASEHVVGLCRAAGTTASIMRYATVYGPGETASHTIPTFIRAALAGQGPAVVGDGFDEHDYIHVADAVDATMSALRRRADGVYNVGTSIGTTTIELANLVVWLTSGPTAPVRRVDPDGETGRSGLVLDTSRMRSELGHEPRHALPDGLKDEIGWFRAQFGGALKTAA